MGLDSVAPSGSGMKKDGQQGSQGDGWVTERQADGVMPMCFPIPPPVIFETFDQLSWIMPLEAPYFCTF